MTRTLDQLTGQKLVLAKYIYHDAVARTERQSTNVARMIAVIDLDLSVETIIKAAGAMYNKKLNDRSLGAIIAEVNAEMLAEGLGDIPYQTDLRQLRTIRNNAQHDAISPTEADTNNCVVWVRNFLVDFTRQLWGVSFDNLSLADFIKSSEAQSYLKQAYVHLSAGKLEDAVIQAKAGLDVAIRKIRMSMSSSLNPLGQMNYDMMGVWYELNGSSEADKKIRQAMKAMITEINKQFDVTRTMILYEVLGIRHTDMLRIHTIGAEVTTMINGQLRVHMDPKPVTLAGAEDVLHTCLMTVLELEARLGDLDKPTFR